MRPITYVIVEDGGGEVERTISHVEAMRRSEHLTKTTMKLHRVIPLSRRPISVTL